MTASRYLNVWQVHEVLGDVNNKLVHEFPGYIKSFHRVVHVVPENYYHHYVKILGNPFTTSHNYDFFFPLTRDSLG